VTDLLNHLVAERMSAAGLATESGVVAGCSRYLELLTKWNKTINLTALDLRSPVPAASVDKLVVEPLLACAFMPGSLSRWVDLGSGGGSPAIPLRVAVQLGDLTMVESRERKCAFLREAARRLGLARTGALAVRFEELEFSGADVVTFRAVRVDDAFVALLKKVAAPSARVLAFGSVVTDAGFAEVGGRGLPDGSVLRVYERNGAD
jgi:16S rRNA (guanine527-N7)-methyltransferase